jgi:hypothetical protein
MLNNYQLPICTAKERWRKEDTYAVMKDGRKTAWRVFNTKEEACTISFKSKDD